MTELYEVVDYGIEYPEHFQGIGTVHTQYEACTYGIGESFNEALEDALESAAQSHGDIVGDLLETIARNESKSPQENYDGCLERHLIEDCGYESLDEVYFSGCYYHVGIRFNIPKEETMKREKFKNLPVGATFEFTSVTDFPLSGLATGPWVKVSERRYKKVGGSFPYRVGTVNVEVYRTQE